MGGRYVYHHLIWATAVLEDERASRPGLPTTSVGWPVHEVGRNADVFDPAAGRLLKANSSIIYESAHLHSNGARHEVEAALRLQAPSQGLQAHLPQHAAARSATASTSTSSRTRPTSNCTPTSCSQQPTKIVTFEPHLHAPGARMCLEAIWGINIQTLTCSGYDHNWVRQDQYEDDYAPLLPKGTILHIIGYMDNTPNNKNIPDPRNWQGSGNRSIANMFIDLGPERRRSPRTSSRRRWRPGAPRGR